MQHLNNLILNTDSYKVSHWLQYPPGTEATFFYVESRGGLNDRTLFFGLQAILKGYLARPLTFADVAEARDFLASHGLPFNEAGWHHIVERHGGRLPLRIRAVAEGSVVPAHQALVTVESTDPDAFWLPGYVETLLLRHWYPTTVATVSWEVKQLLRRYLEQTSDDPEGELPFKLHDFGARGASSTESAGLGGAAHLVSFRGTDTISGVLTARAYYGEAMAGISIPAAEHSTMTAWGEEGEVEAFRNMLGLGAPGGLVAVVSDSYDIHRAVEEHWGKALRQEVIDCPATVVIRPDSGDPLRVLPRCLHSLEQSFGSDTNSKGYRVLRHVRLIQGDGVEPRTIEAMLAAITEAGFSADNIAFGMGGALLQKLDRDTLGFAMKCSAARIRGEWRDVCKKPATDPAKASKAGRLSLLRHRASGEWRTARLPDAAIEMDPASLEPGWEPAMETVWENGELLRDWRFEEVRQRAEATRG